jgi:hypothetical protein
LQLLRRWCLSPSQYDEENERFRVALSNSAFELLLVDDSEFPYMFGVRNAFSCVHSVPL